jgi:Predicted xylanase/chitin deacetylase
MENGYFVISLDFEIYWGVRDVVTLEQYQDNLLGVRKVIPALLELFKKYNINATFATVGLLFFNNKTELLDGLPDRKPEYKNPNLSPYTTHIDIVGNDENEDPLHFAPSLIQQIQQYGQEIGCHTFSHYYCLEDGQTIEDFRADIQAAKTIASKKNIVLKSFVFPRNQYNGAYLNVCKEEGITSFRGNERSGLFSSKNYGTTTTFRRPFRLLDAYINISGHNCYSSAEMKTENLINIPASRFLRPYSKKLAPLDGLRLKRIKNGMTYAAKKNLTYHLWWHPHNFGINIEENLAFLDKILKHYNILSNKYGFRSVGMTKLAELLTVNDGK